MDFLRKEGKNVDCAINSAITELNITLEEAHVKVIDEGTKGILGFGAKPAIVDVCKKFNAKDIAEPFLKDFVSLMDLKVDFLITTTGENKIEVDFIGDDIKHLIGKRGLTLNALQDYLSLSFNRLSNYRLSVIVNIGDYKEKRKETLENLAKSISDKVLESKSSYTLNPMNSYERKIIHSTLQEIDHIKTESVDNEPNRKVVVTYVK